MNLITISFFKDDLVNNETNIEIINRLKARKVQKGGRLLDIQDKVEGWVLPNKDALKMILRLKRMFPWLKFDYRQYLKFKTNLNSQLPVTFIIASKTESLWNGFIELWDKYMNKGKKKKKGRR